MSSSFLRHNVVHSRTFRRTDSMRFFLIFLFVDSIRIRLIFSCEENRQCSHISSNAAVCLNGRCFPTKTRRRRRQIDFDEKTLFSSVEMLGEECQSNDECRRTPVDGSKFCFLNQCQCSPGFVPIDSFRCIRDLEKNSRKTNEFEPPGFGSICSTTNDCQNSIVKFECSRGTCVCLPGFVPLGKYLCYNVEKSSNQFSSSSSEEEKELEQVENSQSDFSNEKRSLGGKCSTDDQCETTNSKCLKNICSCRKGFFPIDDWTCLEDSETSDEEIPSTTTTTTTTTTNVFRWWPWSSSTISTSSLVDAKKTFRFRCLLNRQCGSVDRNSHCTLFGRCICNNGFHLQLINGNERCVEDDCD